MTYFQLLLIVFSTILFSLRIPLAKPAMDPILGEDKRCRRYTSHWNFSLLGQYPLVCSRANRASVGFECWPVFRSSLHMQFGHVDLYLFHWCTCSAVMLTCIYFIGAQAVLSCWPVFISLVHKQCCHVGLYYFIGAHAVLSCWPVFSSLSVAHTVQQKLLVFRLKTISL